jgi:hypothetical protein
MHNIEVSNKKDLKLIEDMSRSLLGSKPSVLEAFNYLKTVYLLGFREGHLCSTKEIIKSLSND